MGIYIKLIRVNNWVKNLIIITPVFFSGQLLKVNEAQIFDFLLTFLCFCFAGSFIYVINDIKDAEKDRLHPTKCKRPIAIGTVSIKTGIYIACFLLLIILALLCFVKWQIVGAIFSYLILNLFYCFGIKNIAILDITSISLGFVLRIIAGGLAFSVPLTHWIIILVFLLMFSIALAKRRDDLLLTGEFNNLFRNSQNGYSLQFIDIAKSISFSVTLVAYIIYSVSDDVISRVGSEYVYITAFPVFLGIMRYLQLSIVYKKSGSPIDLLFKDVFLISMVLSWLLIFTFILYV